MATKTCKHPDCGKTISTLLFSKDSYSNDGLKSWCKFCSGKHKKSWYKGNKERVKKYQKEYGFKYRGKILEVEKENRELRRLNLEKETKILDLERKLNRIMYN